ncbi:hypothetical protein C2869_06695 [Saccharobesus litoralis]|uniref:Uncharacterized protein n=1 Tax=Saccharobesus litoralis TaxID=2172099 RepID=A0A2S0VPK0_9ALTE|nr:hypothetical protein [Saccharobesus litoralis]AWB66145.1 hypothetical protein C2869_06695 [Saccharobesus litoralis]
MEELLVKNASAVFAIIGGLLGSIITGFFGVYGKSRETKLKLAEKIVDKKIEAHDQIINLTNFMRVMCVVEGTPKGNELPRYPAFLKSRDAFDDFWFQLGKVQSQSDRWLSAELKRELYFCVDYLVTLHKWTEQEITRHPPNNLFSNNGCLFNVPSI